MESEGEGWSYERKIDSPRLNSFSLLPSHLLTPYQPTLPFLFFFPFLLHRFVVPLQKVILEDDEVRVALDDDIAQQEEKELGTSSKRPTGKVVGIVKRNWRPYCGVINMPDNPKSMSVLFAPQDRRIPLIRIKTKQADALNEMRIIVCIDSWPADSRYPQGHFVRSLGKAGDVNVETEVVLIEHDVPFEPFSQAVLE